MGEWDKKKPQNNFFAELVKFIHKSFFTYGAKWGFWCMKGASMMGFKNEWMDTEKWEWINWNPIRWGPYQSIIHVCRDASQILQMWRWFMPPSFLLILRFAHDCRGPRLRNTGSFAFECHTQWWHNLPVKDNGPWVQWSMCIFSHTYMLWEIVTIRVSGGPAFAPTETPLTCR